MFHCKEMYGFMEGAAGTIVQRHLWFSEGLKLLYKQDKKKMPGGKLREIREKWLWSGFKGRSVEGFLQ